MKLNFRNVESPSGGGSLTHGVTPLILSSATPNPYTSPPQSTINIPLPPNQRTPSRRCRFLPGTPIFYLIGVVVILTLPFALPVAISHAVRIVDWPQKSNGAYRNGRSSYSSNAFYPDDPIPKGSQRERPMPVSAETALSSQNIRRDPLDDGTEKRNQGNDASHLPGELETNAGSPVMKGLNDANVPQVSGTWTSDSPRYTSETAQRKDNSGSKPQHPSYSSQLSAVLEGLPQTPQQEESNRVPRDTSNQYVPQRSDGNAQSESAMGSADRLNAHQEISTGAASNSNHIERSDTLAGTSDSLHSQESQKEGRLQSTRVNNIPGQVNAASDIEEAERLKNAAMSPAPEMPRVDNTNDNDVTRRVPNNERIPNNAILNGSPGTEGANSINVEQTSASPAQTDRAKGSIHDDNFTPDSEVNGLSSGRQPYEEDNSERMSRKDVSMGPNYAVQGAQEIGKGQQAERALSDITEGSDNNRKSNANVRNSVHAEEGRHGMLGVDKQMVRNGAGTLSTTAQDRVSGNVRSTTPRSGINGDHNVQQVGTVRPGKIDGVQLEKGGLESVKGVRKIDGVVDQWGRYAVVRQGRLFLAETFESRLNEEIGPLLLSMHPRVFGGGIDCGGKPLDVHLSVREGGGVRAEVEMVSKCARGSCLVKAEVEDLRGVWVDIGGEGEHYLRKDGTRWGPMRGELKVRMKETGDVVVKRRCLGGDPNGEMQLVSVGQLRQMVEELRGAKECAQMFEYRAIPRWHIMK